MSDVHEAIRRLATMKPEDDWGDKFYAALNALWWAVKESEIPAQGTPPHVVMAQLIGDVHAASPPAADPLDVERLAQALRHTSWRPGVEPGQPVEDYWPSKARNVAAEYARLAVEGEQR